MYVHFSHLFVLQKNSRSAGALSQTQRISALKLIHQDQLEVELVDTDPLELVTSIFNDVSGEKWRSFGATVWPRLVAVVKEETVQNSGAEKTDGGKDGTDCAANLGKEGPGRDVRSEADGAGGEKRRRETSAEETGKDEKALATKRVVPEA